MWVEPTLVSDIIPLRLTATAAIYADFETAWPQVYATVLARNDNGEVSGQVT